MRHKIKIHQGKILPFSLEVVQSYFDLAKLDISANKIKSFTKWLNKAILHFMAEQERLGIIDDTKERLDLCEDIIKHASKLVKLLANNPELLELEHDILSTLEKNIPNSSFVKEANKFTSNSVQLAVSYALNSKIDTYKLLAELIAIIAKTKIEIVHMKSSQKRGRKQELKALNAFANNFAVEYHNTTGQSITVFREKGLNGIYLSITPAHIIFSEIISRINPILTDEITDKNIINALESAQKVTKK